MTESLIPYTFTPGTKAKAQEVNANFAAVAERIESNNSTAVHENTESTITGQKTFTKPIYSTYKGSSTSGTLILKNLEDTEQSDVILALNDAGKCCGSFRVINGDGYNEILLASANEAGETITLGLRNTDGVAYAYAPTYTEDYSDNSTKIVTTEYMANHWTTKNATTTTTASKEQPAVVVQNYRNGILWYRVWSDGWIEQGGRSNVGDNIQWLNFPKAFTTKDYAVVSAGNGYNAGANLGIITYETGRIQIDPDWAGHFNWYAYGY